MIWISFHKPDGGHDVRPFILAEALSRLTIYYILMLYVTRELFALF